MIYFIQQGQFGPIKIGYSTNPEQRFAAIKTSHHAHLRLLGEIEGSEKDERRLHEKFAPHRIRREWFAPSQDLIDYIRKALNANPFNDWYDADRDAREAEARADGWPGVTPARYPKPIQDIEILPPGPTQNGWIVRSRTADLSIFDDTLEDALWGLINDVSLGVEFGWDLVRFPKEPEEQ
jgi:hypothetical protein